MMKYFIIFLFLAVSGAAVAQSTIRQQAAADFRLVNEAYSGSEKLQMDVNYTLFPSYTSTVAFEKEKGVFMKQGTSTYSCLLGIVSLSNSRVSVTLDSNEQAIVVADPADRRSGTPSLVDVDTLLQMCSSIEYKEQEGGLKFYKLKFDGVTFSEYNAIEVYIDGKTNFISRLMLYYRVEMDLDEEGPKCAKDRPRLEIVYTGINTNPVFSENQFSETSMIKYSGKAYVAASSYSKYRVINNKIR
jgi:hypothetical protein